ncbi:MAG: PTS sugar transporter subunit IIA [Oscillospiraceae bacterium]|nr:PTS sugar transporter subunit IIA [Oscillospiraceae bacterium]
MREEVIPLSNFRVGVKAETWQEAVQAAGQVLLDCGSITQQYIDEMIQAVYDLGPYMVLMPGFALAHAEPSPAVLKDDMSLILLDKPVEFHSENDPVTIVLCVACVNRDSHREALIRVAAALMEDDIYGRLASAQTVEEAYAILHED